SMGVGYLRLIDQDVVDITNLHRQILYDTDSLGYPKVEIAQKRLNALNPHVEIDAIPLTVNEETADDVVKDVDVVLDGLDHFAPRYAINKACVKYNIPYVYGGVLETYGNVTTIIPKKTACLECFLGRLSDEGMPTCETVGVLPSILATVTSIQVSEAVKLLTGSTPSLTNKVLFIDINSLSFTSFNIVNRENCPTCGTPAIKVKPPMSEPKVVELCGKDSFMASPKQPLTLNLAEVADLLKEQFKIKLRSSFGLSLEQSDGVSISLMKTGNALIKGVSDKKDAIIIYDKLMTVLKKTGR
ncbi:MAG: HesA/MoeB/ThiF family protein, partial [Candidatus Bathyarchaeota archaeon]|nr:HesA/MoeB/ThiF family protein [Candidatus Bathyarchaeota archaeon]